MAKWLTLLVLAVTVGLFIRLKNIQNMDDAHDEGCHDVAKAYQSKDIGAYCDMRKQHMKLFGMKI